MTELVGLKGLERKLSEQRIAVTDANAALRLFDPEIWPENIYPR